jgi:hypothetical protein
MKIMKKEMMITRILQTNKIRYLFLSKLFLYLKLENGEVSRTNLYSVEENKKCKVRYQKSFINFY